MGELPNITVNSYLNGQDEVTESEFIIQCEFPKYNYWKLPIELEVDIFA